MHSDFARVALGVNMTVNGRDSTLELCGEWGYYSGEYKSVEFVEFFTLYFGAFYLV